MTLGTSIFLTPLHLENTNLLIPPMRENLCLDASAFDGGSSDGYLLTVPDHQYLGQINDISRLAGELFHPDAVANAEPILLAACLNYCVHFLIPEILVPNQSFRHRMMGWIKTLKGANFRRNRDLGQRNVRNS